MNLPLWGKILEINLTGKEINTIEFSEEDVKKYFLGSGLAAKLLYYDEGKFYDPMSEENPIIIMRGLFTGTRFPGTPKLTISGRSVLTGIWNEATVGGHWPAEFASTGIDGIILRGKAEKPVYLLITDDKVEIKDASHLWGKDCYETAEILKKETPEKSRFCMIGQGGENINLIASVVFDPPNNRVAGRGGSGAWFGLKNLKAIVVRGTKKINVYDEEKTKEIIKQDTKSLLEVLAGFREYGTAGGVEAVEMYGDLPVKNWYRGAYKEEVKKISGQGMQPIYLDKHYACYACPIRCAKIYKNEKRNCYGHAPEYEAIAMLGANCLNDNPDDLIEANEWCNRYGLDTISTGHVIAFAMECYEKGILTKEDTDGLEIRWGGETVIKLVHLIAKREGIGAILADGVKRASKKIGKNSEEYAVHVKGLEVAGHDPRAHVGMSLNYATAIRGGCHLEGLTYFLDRGVPLEDLGYTTPPNPHDSSDKHKICYDLQNYLATFNPLGLCKFLFLGRIGPKKIANWLNAACGWDVDMDYVMKTGERLFNLKRLYNTKLGISRKDDVLPPRLYAWGKPDSAAKGVLGDLGNMLYRYYQLRGWNEIGIPTEEKLKELELI